MKTLSEVLRDGELSYQTLVKYTQMGLIPKPQRVWGGRGKGSQSLFSDDTIDIIKWVKRQQGYGQSLAQIADVLRQAKTEEGEVVGEKPNNISIAFWAAKRLIELHARYPDDDFILGELDEALEEQPDGTVVAKFRIIRVPRK